MDDSELRQRIVDAAVEEGGRRRLTCGQALRIATETDSSPRRVGEICDEEGIKLRDCQLGCF